MKDERVIICMVFGTFLLREAWTLFPHREGVLIKPFPFSDQAIDPRTYVWMMSAYFIQSVIAYVLLLYSDRAHLFFNWLFILAILETIEFLLNYNNYWTKIGAIGINITMLRYPILFISGLWILIRWKN